ncbi:MAG TPA: efflux RND transporter periplasmic adaptor subunit [Gemmatimonadales bacterium]|nr:efflux RND transporter periplasmic adaptor subunit [Gemmatimonadales bacterium]
MMRAIVVAGSGSLCLSLLTSGCERKVRAEPHTPPATGSVPTTVVPAFDPNGFTVEHAERFSLVTAGEFVAAPELNVQGVVAPDVRRQVPVPSLVSGRIVEMDAQLGDTVQTDQVLFKVRSTDVAGAYSDYLKALRNERLAKIQLDRAKALFEVGAIPKSALEIAQTTADNALVDKQTATEHLHALGANPDQPTGADPDPSGIVEIRAPIAGVITDQQITNGSAVVALTPPNPFTISDMSHVWILCDVYENDIAQVHGGEYADIRVTAYPGRVLKGRISHILPVLDPTLRTAKVRLEVENPGILKLGMFVTAIFHGTSGERHASVPATAILHLRDREWVYTPTGEGTFRRQEVVAGRTLPGNLQEVVSGIAPGARVVSDALAFQNSVQQ